MWNAYRANPTSIGALKQNAGVLVLRRAKCSTHLQRCALHPRETGGGGQDGPTGLVTAWLAAEGRDVLAADISNSLPSDTLGTGRFMPSFLIRSYSDPRGYSEVQYPSGKLPRSREESYVPWGVTGEKV